MLGHVRVCLVVSQTPLSGFCKVKIWLKQMFLKGEFRVKGGRVSTRGVCVWCVRVDVGYVPLCF